MRDKLKVAPERPVAQGGCRHYWLIETPNGPTSRGVCKLCGTEREFSNLPPEFGQEGKVSLPIESPRHAATDARETPAHALK